MQLTIINYTYSDVTNNYHILYPYYINEGVLRRLLLYNYFLLCNLIGRTKNSICAIYQGYRYTDTRDGKSTLANKQRWMCVM